MLLKTSNTPLLFVLCIRKFYISLLKFTNFSHTKAIIFLDLQFVQNSQILKFVDTFQWRSIWEFLSGQYLRILQMTSHVPSLQPEKKNNSPY